MKTAQVSGIKILQLILMLAYVLIPHQGDFLDLLSMSSGLRAETVKISDVHGHRLSSLQALIHKVPLDSSPWETDSEPDNLEHPELYTTSQIQSFDQTSSNNVLLFKPLSSPSYVLQINLYSFQTYSQPPPKNLISAHITSTILRI